MAKLLLIDDDEILLARLQDLFTLESHVVEMANSGEDGLQMLLGYSYDAIILDWQMPGISGVAVLKEYRRRGGVSPVLMLTGKDDVASKEEGLDVGADDYLIKPFDARELSARVRALLRRPRYVATSQFGRIALDPAKREVSSAGQSVTLKPKEFALLEFLLRHSDHHYSSKCLLDAVWPSDTDSSEETVRSNMKTLRKQLARIGLKDLIETALRSGYCVRSEKCK